MRQVRIDRGEVAFVLGEDAIQKGGCVGQPRDHHDGRGAVDVDLEVQTEGQRPQGQGDWSALCMQQRQQRTATTTTARTAGGVAPVAAATS